MPASPQTQVRMGTPRRRNAGIGSPGCSTQLALRLTPRISLGPAHRGTFMTGVKFREKIRIRGVVRKKKKDCFQVYRTHSADLGRPCFKRWQTDLEKRRSGGDTQELFTSGCISLPRYFRRDLAFVWHQNRSAVETS